MTKVWAFQNGLKWASKNATFACPKENILQWFLLLGELLQAIRLLKLFCIKCSKKEQNRGGNHFMFSTTIDLLRDWRTENNPACVAKNLNMTYKINLFNICKIKSGISTSLKQ